MNFSLLIIIWISQFEKLWNYKSRLGNEREYLQEKASVQTRVSLMMYNEPVLCKEICVKT